MQFSVRILAAAVVCAISFEAFGSPDVLTRYTREINVPPLSLSYADVEQVLASAFNLTQSANLSNTNALRFDETLRISSENGDVTVSSHLFPMTSHLPEASRRIEYICNWPNGAVSNIRIELKDYERTVSVTGYSEDHVDAVVGAVERGLAGHTAWATGMLFRQLLAMTFAILLAWGVTCWLKRISRDPLPWYTNSIFTFLFMIAIMGLVPLSRLFPGFSAFKGDASFIVRRAPEISAFSCVMGILAIPLGSLIPMWISKARKVKTASKSHPKPDSSPL